MQFAKDRWPLLQLGPGIMTVNDTYGYEWPDFQRRCEKAVECLFDAHPKRDEFEIQDMTLRYIDADEFNYEKDSIFDYLRTMMKVKIELPENLFHETGIKGNPSAFSWQTSFVRDEVGGRITLRFSTGENEGKPALVWETLVQAAFKDLPEMPNGFSEWLDSAHKLTDDWFFKLIEGDLERKYS